MSGTNSAEPFGPFGYWFLTPFLCLDRAQEGMISILAAQREREEWGPALRLSQFCPWRSTCVRDLNVGWFASQTRRSAYSGEFSNFFAESASRLRIGFSTSAKTAAELQNQGLCVVRAIGMQPHRSCKRDTQIPDSTNDFHSDHSDVVCCSNCVFRFAGSFNQKHCA